MRSYVVIAVALVVLIAGLVARRCVGDERASETSGAVPAVVAAGTRAQNAADALASALAAGQRGVAQLDPRVRRMREDCEALEKLRPTPACAALRSKGDALQRAARNDAIAGTVAAEFQAAAAALRGELGR